VSKTVDGKAGSPRVTDGVCGMLHLLILALVSAPVDSGRPRKTAVRHLSALVRLSGRQRPPPRES